LSEYVNYALLYNKALLNKAGIQEPPKTPEEFLEVAKALTNPPDQYGYGTRHTMPEQGGWWYELSYWVEGFGGRWAVDGQPTVNTPEVVAGIQFFKQMYDEGVFPKGVDAATYRRMFWEEKVGLLTDNQAVYVITRDQNPNIALEVAPSPFDPPITHVEAGYLALPADAKHPQEAAVLLEWLYQHIDEYGLNVQTLTGSKKANTRILEKFPYLKVWSELPVVENGGILPPGFETVLPEFRQIVLERVTQVLVENRDVQAAMDQAQAELMKLAERVQQE
jgi:multiple sugar transport system substrate-binding protein